MSKNQRVAKDKVIEIFIKFYDSQGEELSQEHCLYLHGGYDDILPKLEEALAEKTIGFETTLYLEPEDAFGEYDENLVFVEPRELFPAEIQEGMVFEGIPMKAKTKDIAEKSKTASNLMADVEEFMAQNREADDEDDENSPQFFVVQQVTPTHVLLDANPEWAGMAIQIFCRIESIREASAQELEQGYANDLDEDSEEAIVSVLPKKDGKLH
jgi:FKBP-type peptidyl-prolyl cis-trans isomerase SlyD